MLSGRRERLAVSAAHRPVKVRELGATINSVDVSEPAMSRFTASAA
jgi:hypothetical protein